VTRNWVVAVLAAVDYEGVRGSKKHRSVKGKKKNRRLPYSKFLGPTRSKKTRHQTVGEKVNKMRLINQPRKTLWKGEKKVPGAKRVITKEL